VSQVRPTPGCQRERSRPGFGPRLRTRGVSELVGQRWGPCPNPCPPCLGDLDADCAVGVTDFLILLANWS
jgi:hypothetical protein